MTVRSVFGKAALTAGLTIAASLVSAPTYAHPHMFFDAQAQFVLDAEGRLTGLDIGFVVDDFNTLYTLAELSLDGDGDGVLTEGEQATLANALNLGLGDYGYFTDLRIGDDQLDLGTPNILASLQQGRIAARLSYALDAPLPIDDDEAVLALYDPTYFTAVTMAAAPVLRGGPTSCEAVLDAFEPSVDLAATQAALAALSREETPSEPNIGARFADRARLQCTG